jgi:hypothetical protein
MQYIVSISCEVRCCWSVSLVSKKKEKRVFYILDERAAIGKRKNRVQRWKEAQKIRQVN